MSEFLGARISLISRSDIRYVGTLHQINSDDSTVSLQNVRSYGTEGRKAVPEEEIAPSDQLYEYIVFRGTDVKDLKIEEGPAAVKEQKPPVMPNDPAIVGAHPRPGHVAPPGPPGPPGPSGPPVPPGPHGMPNQQGPPPGGPGFGYFPPNMGGWGRAGPPGPNPFGGMPGQYPPPQWFPPGQEFHGMGPGPGPWNNYAYPPGPGGHPGAHPPGPGPVSRQSANHTPNNQTQTPKPAPIGPAAERKPAPSAQQPEIPSEPKPVSQAPKQPAATPGPPPPVESKPSVEEVKATVASLANNGQPSAPPTTAKAIPTGPKISRPTQILPAVPLPVALTSKATQGQASASKPAGDAGAAAPVNIKDATQAARDAVARAMADMNHSADAQRPNGNTVDVLTNKVNEMRVGGATRAPQPPRRGGQGTQGVPGGQGRAPRPAKVEVPDSDFDFASANAKFNKQDVVKEAIAGSPLTETPVGGQSTPEAVSETGVPVLPAYNKSKSFFDNISSEAKDRLENNGQKPGGREWRGEEQRKNMETFGQGSVDGGFRGYRGRGRGRGGRGRGFRGGRGNNAGYRPRDAQPAPQ